MYIMFIIPWYIRTQYHVYIYVTIQYLPSTRYVVCSMLALTYLPSMCERSAVLLEHSSVDGMDGWPFFLLCVPVSQVPRIQM